MQRPFFRLSLIALLLSQLGCIGPHGGHPTTLLLGIFSQQPTTKPLGVISGQPLIAPAGVFLFSHTVIPLDVNASGGELAGRKGRLDTKHWSYLVTLEWDGRGIGQIAKEYGFSHVDHADLEVLRILGGVWTQRHVHIYGTRE